MDAGRTQKISTCTLPLKIWKFNIQSLVTLKQGSTIFGPFSTDTLVMTPMLCLTISESCRSMVLILYMQVVGLHMIAMELKLLRMGPEILWVP
jgi:hypothetical protein